MFRSNSVICKIFKNFPVNASQKMSNSRKVGKNKKLGDFTAVKDKKLKTEENVTDFKFNVQRVRTLVQKKEVKSNSDGIVYWMSRDQRIQDNWALLFAQKLAIENEVPLYVVFCLVPKFLDATLRQYYFLLEGLKEVEQEAKMLEIPFHLLIGPAKDNLVNFVKDRNIGAIVGDFSSLKTPRKLVEDLVQTLPPSIPFYEVDAHNVVPCWIASDKQEYSARTIRKKINDKLSTFLTEFPLVVKHKYNKNIFDKKVCIDWKAAYASLDVDKSVEKVDWAKPGKSNGLEVLQTFCKSRLKTFSTERNDPTKNSLSNLSPWIHFGQISVQRCVLEVKKIRNQAKESVDAYIEEAIIRRELADNFCFYQPNYDNIKGAYDWAQKTLNDHKKDKRPYIYSQHELEKSLTHDELWNSAQIQLKKEGKMHGFLRMYWAKKILEWMPSPEESLATAIYLNDKYSLDGRDPNGYVGCMWSICGIHDQGWREREVFGKIRYMNYEGCKRKFNVAAFVAKYGGKIHCKKAKISMASAFYHY